MKQEVKKIIAREFLIITAVLILSVITFLSIYPYNWFKSTQINSISKYITLQDKILDSLSNSYKKKSENQDWLYNQFKDRFEEPVKAAYRADKSDGKPNLSTFNNFTLYISATKAISKEENSKRVKNKTWLEIAKQVTEKGLSQYALNENDIDGIGLKTNDELESSQDFWNNLYTLERADSISILWNKQWVKPLTDFFTENGFKNSNELSNFIKTNTIYTTEIKLKDSTQQQKDVAVQKKNTINNSMLSVDDQKEFAFKGLLIFFCILFPLRYLYYGIKWSLSTLKN